MIVKKIFPTDTAGHTIEIGLSTYDRETPAIRNRYTDINGRYNRHGSKELMITDIPLMIIIAAKEDQFEWNDLVAMLAELSAALLRTIRQ